VHDSFPYGLDKPLERPILLVVDYKLKPHELAVVAFLDKDERCFFYRKPDGTILENW
jgi:hypothetical protein